MPIFTEDAHIYCENGHMDAYTHVNIGMRTFGDARHEKMDPLEIFPPGNIPPRSNYFEVFGPPGPITLVYC